MTAVDRLTAQEGLELALRLFAVGLVLGPVTVGTGFTVMIYATAVAAGENMILRLLLFPFGWIMAFVFLWMPVSILCTVLIGFRLLVGPWTIGLLALIVLPLCVMLSGLMNYWMGSSNFQDVIGDMMHAATFGPVCFAIILSFWALRGKLGLARLGHAKLESGAVASAAGGGQ